MVRDCTCSEMWRNITTSLQNYEYTSLGNGLRSAYARAVCLLTNNRATAMWTHDTVCELLQILNMFKKTHVYVANMDGDIVRSRAVASNDSQTSTCSNDSHWHLSCMCTAFHNFFTFSYHTWNIYVTLYNEVYSILKLEITFSPEIHVKFENSCIENYRVYVYLSVCLCVPGHNIVKSKNFKATKLILKFS